MDVGKCRTVCDAGKRDLFLLPDTANQPSYLDRRIDIVVVRLATILDESRMPDFPGGCLCTMIGMRMVESCVEDRGWTKAWTRMFVKGRVP